jgi:hypothetical protein
MRLSTPPLPAALEYHNGARTGLLDPLLQFAELDLELEQLRFVNLGLQLPALESILLVSDLLHLAFGTHALPPSRRSFTEYPGMFTPPDPDRQHHRREPAGRSPDLKA